MRYVCRACGRKSGVTTDPPELVRAKCRGEPSLWAKIGKFFTARSRWVAAGKPLRTAERIREIKALCAVCPHRDIERNACRLCGCALRMKIKWATEPCPARPPLWLADAAAPPP